MTSSAPQRERGLSLVELVVAMMVLMVVMGLVIRTMGQGMQARDSVAGDAAASMSADQTIDQMSSDLRNAENPARRLATDNEILSGTDGTNANVEDVLVAEPYRLVVRSEVYKDPNPAIDNGVECLTYQVDREGSLWRMISVFVGGVCAPATVSVKRIMTGSLATGTSSNPSDQTLLTQRYTEGMPAIPAAKFSYQSTGAPAGGRCQRTELPGPVALADRAKIIGVTVTLTPTVNTRTDVSQTKVTDTIALRSRSGLSYRRAIGCINGVVATAG